jgi:hypothetical protein
MSDERKAGNDLVISSAAIKAVEECREVSFHVPVMHTAVQLAINAEVSRIAGPVKEAAQIAWLALDSRNENELVIAKSVIEISLEHWNSNCK